MIKMLPNRILVKVLPRYEGQEKKLDLILVDKKKHYEEIRRGTVEAMGRGISSVVAGEVVLFRGDAGESFGMDAGSANDGTDYRRLSAKDILAVEEIVAEEVAA